jgi:hypothetical protein
MNVNDTYVLMQYILNKNQQGYLSPADFNNIINQAQRSYISYLKGSIQRYQYNVPFAPVELGNSMTLRQILSPVIVERQLSVGANGFSPYPEDYVIVDALWTLNNFNRIRAVEQDKLYSFYNSQIDPIADWPIYLIKDTGFQFYPQNLGSVKLSYVKEAPAIIWSYTLDGNGRPVYSEAGPQIATTGAGTGWTGLAFSSGYTHTTPAGTAPLIGAFSAVSGLYYNITLTITGATAGTYVDLNFGGLTTSTGVSTTILGYASASTPLTITPHNNFDGTIRVTVNQASTQPVWGGTTMLDVISRALLMVGVNLQAPQVLSYATEIKNQGQ